MGERLRHLTFGSNEKRQKMNIIRILAVIILITGIVSCVDKYWPEIDKYENVLVVDGLLTNYNESIEVTLSYSSSVNNGDFIPATDARVSLRVNDSYDIDFVESPPGKYKLSDTTFTGEIGYTYQLFIETPEGKRYNSDVCNFNGPSPIDSLYGEQAEYQETYSDDGIIGIQFYIDNHNNTCDTCYYLWKLNQTYKYKASFYLDYVWVGEFLPFPNHDSLRTCYHTSEINDIYILSTKYFDNSTVRKHPLNFVDTKTKELSIRYSLEARQLSISKEAFYFFDAIEQQNIDQGNYYSKQPVQIRGNIKNITNPKEPVLGYFVVAGETRKRIFMDRPGIPFYYVECVPDHDLRFIRFYPPNMWPIYITDIMFDGWAMGPSNSCFDCRLDGGKLTPPDFWTDY